MGTFWHKIKRNETTQEPRNWVFVDCEAHRQTLSDGEELQTLAFGAAVYYRPGRDRNPPLNRWWMFDNPSEFWDGVFDRVEQDRPCYVCAYNMGYDCRLLDTVNQLENRGYEQKGIYVSQAAFLFQWRSGDHKITLIDAMNWLSGSLASWSGLVDLPKFDDYLDAVDETYFRSACCRDVEILRAVVLQWLAFRRGHDLGVFRPTKASQAMAAFKHRYMDHDIVIHAHEEAHEVERASYHGGRCEAWHIGYRKDGPFHMLDVNSLYPYIMRVTPVPTKLWTVTQIPDQQWISDHRERFNVIADVLIETDEPIYPVHRDAKLIWPVGVFRCTLPHPELLAAIDRGHVQSVTRVAYYDQAIIFRRYVDELYALRMEQKQQGNTIYEQLTKYLLNSLYGKWGQYSETWEALPADEFMEQGYHEIVNMETQRPHPAYVVGETCWEITGRSESRDSFPGIAATITSAARMHLWRLIETAGVDHVYYMDTDSLLVDQAGYDNLSGWIDSATLGMLDLEETTPWFEIVSAKDYRTASKGKTKGVPASASQADDGSWSYTQMEGFRGALHHGVLDKVRARKATKTRQSRYEKGHVSPDGSVLPWSLSEA